MAKTLADGFGVLVEVLKALGTLGEERYPLVEAQMEISFGQPCDS